MRILVTNDDGFESTGLKVLVELAMLLSDDVWVVAPEVDQSGSGTSVRNKKRVDFRKHGEKFFIAFGTPGECVYVSLVCIMADHPPDLILSGINMGANVSASIISSGTVGAALEGIKHSIKSAAISKLLNSQDFVEDDESRSLFSFENHNYVRKIIEYLLGLECWTTSVAMNINLPTLDPSGVVFVSQGTKNPLANEHVSQRESGSVTIHARLDYHSHDSCIKLLQKGMVTITPMGLDMTNYPCLNCLKEESSTLEASVGLPLFVC